MVGKQAGNLSQLQQCRKMVCTLTSSREIAPSLKYMGDAQSEIVGSGGLGVRD